MIKKLYYWFYRFTSLPQDKGLYAGGYWQGRIRQEMIKSCQGIKGNVLEIGCAEGLLLHRLAEANPQAEFYGIDNDLSRLDKIKKNLPNMKASLQDARKIDFPDGYFNLIICVNFLLNLESLDSVRGILSEMRRACKKSGRLIFEFRNSLNPFFVIKYKLAGYYDATVRGHNLNTYYPRDVMKILQELNLEVCNMKFIGWGIKKLAPIIIIEAKV